MVLQPYSEFMELSHITGLRGDSVRMAIWLQEKLSRALDGVANTWWPLTRRRWSEWIWGKRHADI